MHAFALATLILATMTPAAMAWGRDAEDRATTIYASMVWGGLNCVGWKANPFVAFPAIQGNGLTVGDMGRPDLQASYLSKMGELRQSPSTSCGRLVSLFGPRGTAVADVLISTE